VTVNRPVISTILSFVCGIYCLAAVAEDAQDEVLKVADRALELITLEDFPGLANLMISDAITVSNRIDGGSHQIRTQSASEQAATKPSADLVERGFDPKVMVDNSVAMVWYPYDIYINNEWSHCGVDIFSLVQTDMGWKIGSIVYSVQQPPQCQPHPDGKPH